MKITSKGQVTIPIAIRRELGLLPHTEVEFVVDGNQVILRKRPDPPPPGRGARIVAHLRGRGDVPMTTDEIMALTRGRD